MRKFKTSRINAGMGRQPTERQDYRAQWSKDYRLLPWGNEALFSEYLEMGTNSFWCCSLVFDE